MAGSRCTSHGSREQQQRERERWDRRQRRQVGRSSTRGKQAKAAGASSTRSPKAASGSGGVGCFIGFVIIGCRRWCCIVYRAAAPATSTSARDGRCVIIVVFTGLACASSRCGR